MRCRWLVVAVVVAACAAPAVDGDGLPGPAEPTDPTTQPTIVEPSTSTSSTTTGVPPSTTSTSAPSVEPITPLPTLPDGRPATFMAVTDDYAAVEVDTASGRILRTLGQVADREALENAECAACVNVIDAVWRAVDGSRFYVSECCEPAAGVIFALDPGEQITETTPVSFQAWTVTPSPTSREFVAVGYQIGLGSGAEVTDSLFPDDGSLGSSTATWLSSGEIGWLDRDDAGRWTLFRLELDADPPEPRAIPLTWADDDDFLPDLTTQASGNLVTFRRSFAEPDGPVEGIVFTPDGELVATFSVEDGAELGGYDPGGRFLIYVDGSATARWQGMGRSGILGEGFVFASW